ncbi:acylphosphatase [Thermococci archaeon]|nr:MAG: acylphosphatase [Thermococci archaeon]
MARVSVFIYGRVQGVFYRDFVQKNANRLGLTGWVKNLADGRVEAELEGDKEVIEKMLMLMRQGPAAARVDSLETTWIKEKGDDTFKIIY